jgi:hypothetical protein|tara:strand:+ start:9920 stop:10105 length:186 start_codon:yes stop_codon:yes gene_type:complete
MEKDLAMIEAMSKYGGSFVQTLAALLSRADPINYAKLKATFPEYFGEYKDMSERNIDEGRE